MSGNLLETHTSYPLSFPRDPLDCCDLSSYSIALESRASDLFIIDESLVDVEVREYFRLPITSSFSSEPPASLRAHGKRKTPQMGPQDTSSGVRIFSVSNAESLNVTLNVRQSIIEASSYKVAHG